MASTTARSAEKIIYCCETGALVAGISRAGSAAYLHGMAEVAVISAAVLAVGALLVLRFLPGGRSAVGETRVSPRSNEVNHRVHPVRPR
ncbi:MAG: hypothetical protein WAL72_02185 [Streptosporangiaceae bacterium]